MFQRNRRGFRRRSNGRGRSSHQENGYMQVRSRSKSFSSNHTRNNFRSAQSAEKLLEKYNSLAKEAMSLDDKTLCENYLQHADHFMRVIEDKNKNRNNNKVDASSVENKVNSFQDKMSQESQKIEENNNKNPE